MNRAWETRCDDLAESIARAKSGGSAALGQLLESFREYLLKVANEELAEEVRRKESPSDLVQQTFLEAARAFPAFRGGSVNELLAWLRRILLNNVHTVNGREKPKVRREQPLNGANSSREVGGGLMADEPSPSNIFRRMERAEALHAALARLPENYRAVIAWHHQDQLTFAEIGARLGRSDEAARALWSRALEKLQRELSLEHGPESSNS